MSVIVIAILISIFLVWWNTSVPRSESYTETVKLPFDFIKNLYAVSPERLRYERVECERRYGLAFRKALLINYCSNNETMWAHRYRYDSCSRRVETNAYIQHDEIVGVKLSLFDKIKFLVAKHRNPNNKKTIEQILEVMQADIDKLREQANAQIKQAEAITKTVEKNNKDSFPKNPGTIYFSDRHGTLEKIKENVPFEKAGQVITDAVKEKNPYFVIYYMRQWKENNYWVFDVGSHRESFIFKENQ